MVAIYCDGAGISQMRAYAKDERIAGFTTNPTLMKMAGITEYRDFAHAVIGVVEGKPVSFEVLADDIDGMERQASEIAEWASNVYVKIPIVTAGGQPTTDLLRRLTENGVKVNVTAVMTPLQAALASASIATEGCIISVFAGRIADTRTDPEPMMLACSVIAHAQKQKVLWASAREVFNVVQAERTGADIITLSPELIAKLDLRGKDLTQYSRETVKQFVSDGKGIEF